MFSLVFIVVAVYIAIYSRESEDSKFFYDTSSAIQSVKGISDRKPLTNEEKVIFDARKTLVTVNQKYCGSLTILPELASTLKLSLTDSYYPFCSQITGIGFFIESSGFIATSTTNIKRTSKEYMENELSGALASLIKESSLSANMIIEKINSKEAEFRLDSSDILIELGSEEIPAKLIDIKGNTVLLKIDKNVPAILDPSPLLEDQDAKSQDLVRSGDSIYAFAVSRALGSGDIKVTAEGQATWAPKVVSTVEEIVKTVRLHDIEIQGESPTAGSPAVSKSGRLVGIYSNGKLQKINDLQNLLIKNIANY